MIARASSIGRGSSSWTRRVVASANVSTRSPLGTSAREFRTARSTRRLAQAFALRLNEKPPTTPHKDGRRFPIVGVWDCSGSGDPASGQPVKSAGVAAREQPRDPVENGERDEGDTGRAYPPSGASPSLVSGNPHDVNSIHHVAGATADIGRFQMRISHRRLDVGVTENVLDLVDVHSVLDQTRRMRMAQRVDRAVAQAGANQRLPDRAS